MSGPGVASDHRCGLDERSQRSDLLCKGVRLLETKINFKIRTLNNRGARHDPRAGLRIGDQWLTVLIPAGLYRSPAT